MSAEMNNTPATAGTLTRKDFLSSIEPKWCPGCGTFSVFRSLTNIFPTLGIPKEKFAIISGIGCSSRFPYYANTYGFHTIHGRAPTVALGLKLAQPDLSVWVISGDGDALSIGGNHFFHLIRRNPDIKLILFNNQIYGLTKGQASPTTPTGQKTKTTPFGSVDTPVRPLSLALAAGATFAARATDSQPELLNEVLIAAAKHKGMAFVEVLLNCVIFNDGAFDSITDKTTRADTTLHVRHGEPLVFGANHDKGIRFNPATLKPEICEATEKDVIVFDKNKSDLTLAFGLSQLAAPIPLGIFRETTAPTYEERLPKEDTAADLDKALKGSSFWTVR